MPVYAKSQSAQLESNLRDSSILHTVTQSKDNALGATSSDVFDIVSKLKRNECMLTWIEAGGRSRYPFLMEECLTEA